MEEKMRELGRKFSCISTVKKSRPICAKSVSIRSSKFSTCQEHAREPLHYATMCSKYQEIDNDECGCSMIKEKEQKTGCHVFHDESCSSDDEDSGNSERSNERKNQLKNQCKTSRLASEHEYHRYQAERRKKPRGECANKHWRNALRTQVSHLLKKIEPTRENCILDSTETRPEPEILAEVLLMSEVEGADLSSLSPDNIFNKVFAESRDRPSYSSNRNPGYSPTSPGIINENGKIISPIASNFEQARNQSTYSNEGYDDSTRYQELPPLRTKIPENSEPTGYSTPIGSTSENFNLGGKNHWLPEGCEFTTKIQINGSIKPLWFPGYVVISSIQPNSIRITTNPEAALSEIWRLCKPQNILPASKFTIT